MAKQINVCGGDTIFIPPCDPGGDCELTTKSITQNGSYDASDDYADGYSRVTVNVPNTYGAGDEGKVVKNGALVNQTSLTVTENDTYDTTDKNEVVVDVQTQAILKQKTIVDNGIYLASSDDANGYDQVIVNVPCSGEHGLRSTAVAYFNSDMIESEFTWEGSAKGWIVS